MYIFMYFLREADECDIGGQGFVGLEVGGLCAMSHTSQEDLFSA